MLDGECIPETYVKVPLKMINRHGLIAGATGTGKTKTLQVIAEQLSEKGVPVILMDLKGDLSGLAQPGEEKELITKRLPGLASPIRRNLCPLS
jgi:DNA helicase HerA-like ATPase